MATAERSSITLATKSKNVTYPAAIFWRSPFDSNPDLPPRIRRHILEVAIIIPPARSQLAKPDFRGAGRGILREGSPLYPLRAILEERLALTWELPFQFGARPVKVRFGETTVSALRCFGNTARATRCRKPPLRQFRAAPGI